MYVGTCMRKKVHVTAWSSHFKYMVNEVEHIVGDDAWRLRETLLCQQISSILVYCIH